MTATVLLTTVILVVFITALSLRIIFQKDETFRHSCSFRGNGKSDECMCDGHRYEQCARTGETGFRINVK